MKKITIKQLGIILLGIWILFSGSSDLLGAGISQAQFDKANQVYESGNFTEALRLYSDIEKNGSNWKLFYNMGNCYYKLNQPVRAKIYFLKARRFEPFDASIRKNIEIVNKQLNDKIPYARPDFVSQVVLKIESVLSLNVTAVLLILFSCVFCGFVLTWIRKGKSRFRVYGVVFSFLLTLLIGSYHLYRVDKFNSRDVAVIIKENSELRSGPGESNTILFKVNPGLEVRIIDVSGVNWCQVSASSEIAGWIEVENLERI